MSFAKNKLKIIKLPSAMKPKKHTIYFWKQEAVNFTGQNCSSPNDLTEFSVVDTFDLIKYLPLTQENK